MSIYTCRHILHILFQALEGLESVLDRVEWNSGTEVWSDPWVILGDRQVEDIPRGLCVFLWLLLEVGSVHLLQAQSGALSVNQDVLNPICISECMSG